MLVKLGYALRSHGLSGNVLFSLLDIEKNVLQEGKKIFLFPMKGSELPPKGLGLAIRYLNLKGGLMAFTEITSREDMACLLPFSIHMERKLFPPLPQGEFYTADLLGLSVKKSGTKEEVGIVNGHYHTKQQTILQIEGKKKYELPLVKEFFPVIRQDRLEMVIPQYI